MHGWMAPLCLVLCLALLITAFALLAIDAPEANVDLHRARVTRDEAMRDVLEEDLKTRIWLRRGLIAALFVAAFALGVGGFLSVGGSRR
ncbi:MAG: hypothetical protein FJ276_33880 [Planctomycetes bacterium]|nr:hypothetical protein [Planctomycetota bacterium]